ncbi:hypothetical protein OBBRIDRAFT_188504 [Obba rivulosa]|uniref:Uncharacterized protein n=1 Tax=Obba rivulosa TaxID=1052685 RepID=A0A8E2AUL5_9APHY|nr:hypothetical protein OBBRIDRAFT_188504 [Obba rivulosa]
MYYEGIQRPGNVYYPRQGPMMSRGYSGYSGSYYDGSPDMRMAYQYNQPVPQPQMLYRQQPMQYSRFAHPYRQPCCCDACCDTCCESCCAPGCC